MSFPELSVTRRAGIALTRGQAVGFDASGDLVVATAAIHIAGLVQEGGALGDSLPLAVGGVAFAIAGAALVAGTAAGNALEVEAATGRLVTLAAGIAVARWIPSQDKATAADGDIIQVVLI